MTLDRCWALSETWYEGRLDLGSSSWSLTLEVQHANSVRMERNDSPNTIGGAADDLWIIDRDAALHRGGDGWSAPDLDLALGDGLYDAWPAGDGFTYVLLHRSGVEGVFLARRGSSGVGYIRLPSGAALDGAGRTVWVLSYRSLYRYVHDPLEVFP